MPFSRLAILLAECVDNGTMFVWLELSQRSRLVTMGVAAGGLRARIANRDFLNQQKCLRIDSPRDEMRP
ncbi:MAG TPA: hypothetical protein VFA80_12375 [Xanthobacteraceae bacterium]|nr:hypothetical protein [Xanthobacteraceae bacterium]